MALFIPYIIVFSFDISISKHLEKIQRFPADNEIWNDIYKSRINSEYIILGSSRAWVHISPKIITENLHTSAYNLGEDGSNILRQYLRFKEYINYNIHPNKIILNVDIYSLTRSTFPQYHYYPYMLLNTRILRLLNELGYNEFNKVDFLVPLIRYLRPKYLVGHIFNKEIQPILLGDKQAYLFKDVPQYIDENGCFRQEGYRGIDAPLKIDTSVSDIVMEIDPFMIDLLDRFIAEIKANKIDLVLVWTPELISGQDVCLNRKEIDSVFSHMALKYEVPYYNYSDSAISKDSNLFYNVEHLNKEGSEKFTSLLIKKL